MSARSTTSFCSSGSRHNSVARIASSARIIVGSSLPSACRTSTQRATSTHEASVSTPRVGAPRQGRPAAVSSAPACPASPACTRTLAPSSGEDGSSGRQKRSSARAISDSSTDGPRWSSASRSSSRLKRVSPRGSAYVDTKSKAASRLPTHGWASGGRLIA